MKDRTISFGVAVSYRSTTAKVNYLLHMSEIEETGCNGNRFCFGNSGTETIRDIRLLFTCVQTLVI